MAASVLLLQRRSTCEAGATAADNAIVAIRENPAAIDG